MPAVFKGKRLGSFTEYTPDPHPLPGVGAYFCQNERGQDLYAIRNRLKGGLYVIPGPDGRIVAAATHPFVPLPMNGQEVWHIESLGADDEASAIGGTVEPEA